MCLWGMSQTAGSRHWLGSSQDHGSFPIAAQPNPWLKLFVLAGSYAMLCLIWHSYLSSIKQLQILIFICNLLFFANKKFEFVRRIDLTAMNIT
ncbi:MAG: hypothetical protein EZS28_000741 [Streblomastix strix]|uniref:Uncharacterized protein n=1 Tax=Streblomastix strix TaxID=222440 RepID=A0A5J4X9Y6_9EUKA|nr:MAG: hypothetical protein EZS28_000741 [Streblomastix strix]